MLTMNILVLVLIIIFSIGGLLLNRISSKLTRKDANNKKA